MAQFKIDLLTPSVVETANNEFNFSTPYLITRISEFYKQTDEFNNEDWIKQKNTYTFTFDEKVSFHKNAQKELTFSMLRNVWVENEFVVNPFVSALHVGAQLLLTDKDGNEHIFTVKNVNYTPTSENMLYAYTCQDSFSYQGARQNAGYTIENDSTSEDFIGAENIDFWANKIKEECHIGYEYLGLKDNLWIGQDGNVHTGTISSLNKIIKHAYNETNHKDYFATIPFSVSGSSASAALISLAEQLGFMLNVCEKTEQGSDGRIYISSYFWLEPEKHEQVSGLKYSPYSSIQNFTFSHAGESLSTVLNVESNTFDDELITLLPDVPEFFIEYFESDEWRNSSFYDGMFTDVCQGKIFKSNDNIGSDFNIEDGGIWFDEGFVYFNLVPFKIPQFYNNFKFEDSFKESEFYLNTVRHTPYLSEWSLGYWDDADEWVEVSKENGIQQAIKETLILRVRPLSSANANKENLDIAHLDLIFNFYRDTTQDELDFAAIADKCPWLENKLIDFSYFLENKIINKKEYNSLQNIVKNTLRKVNGQLLAYTKAYYQATKKKVETLATLTNDIDSIGAAFQSDIMDPYAENGDINDISYFETAYYKWAVNKPENTKNELLHLNNILSDYANKYFQTQQRFLKNIYNFRKYFEAPVNWNSRNTTIYPRTLTTLMSNDCLLFFSESAFVRYDKSTKHEVVINQEGKPNKILYLSDLKTPVEYVNNKNYTQYKCIVTNPDNFMTENKYNSDRQYYRRCLEIELKEVEDDTTENKYIDAPSKITIGADTWYLHIQEFNLAYYILPGNPALDNINFDSIDIQDDIGEKIRIIEKPVIKTDMIREYLYSHQNLYTSSSDENLGLYTKGDIRYFDYFFTNDEIKAMRKWFGKELVNNHLAVTVAQAVLNSDDNMTADPLQWIFGNSANNADDFKDNYKKYFPIENLYITQKPHKWIVNESKGHWEEDAQAEEQLYELPFVKQSNYENYYCRTLVVNWPWKDNVKWKTGGGWCYGTWDGSRINETGFVSKTETVYAPSSSSYEDYLGYYINRDETQTYKKCYEGYYRYKAETYISAHEENKTRSGYPYKYKSKMLKVIKDGQKINRNSIYKVLPIGEKYIKQAFIEKALNDDNTMFSDVQYYPIMACSAELNQSKYSWKENQSLCEVSDILNIFTEKNENWKYNSITKTWYYEGSSESILVLVEQDYTENLLVQTANWWKDLEKISINTIYTDNHIVFDATSQEDFAKGFLFKKTLDEALEAPTEFSNTIYYYNDNQERVYTAEQLIEQESCFFLRSRDTIKYNSYEENNYSFSANAKLYDKGVIKDLGYIVLTPDSVKDRMMYDGDTIKSGSIQLIDKENNKTYTINVQIENEEEIDLSGKTNAYLWNKYHSDINSPLFEEAAKIETQLEEYWLQAYNASKYCEFFLPEHWQPTVNGQNNHFSSLVFDPNTLILSTTTIPVVNIVKNQGTSLPKYNFTIKTTSNDNIIPYLGKQNIAIKTAFKNLGIEDNYNWIGQLVNVNMTYYYAQEETGMKWVEVLGRLCPGAEKEFNKFDGIYPMTFKFLNQNFKEQQLVDYENSLKQHNEIWNNLYKFFPGIILETTYNNPDATTSQDLFILATNYFKDLSRPERGYSISVIDAASLSGYKGQELHIGDAIELDAEEFYDEYDAIKKTLSQYLFITDISYDLRKDSDIQLTVNSIKYQEKLIQRLVKLIK